MLDHKQVVLGMKFLERRLGGRSIRDRVIKRGGEKRVKREIEAVVVGGRWGAIWDRSWGGRTVTNYP